MICSILGVVLFTSMSSLILDVNSMQCSTETSSGQVVCIGDDRRRLQRLMTEEELAEAHKLAREHDDARSRTRRLSGDTQSNNDPDCPLCTGVDWTCGESLTQCGLQNDFTVFDGCYCDTDLDGNAVCWQDTFCSLVTDCDSTDDCGDGYVCATSCCGGTGQCLEKCENEEGAQYDNALPEQCDTCNLPNLPDACDNNPCSCDPSSESADMSLCNICHNNVGCSECDNVGTNWKIDYNYPCIDCQDTFGQGCMFCQDFHGCGQCDESNYWIRVKSEACSNEYNRDIWECIDCRDIYGEGCAICQESQCGQCKNGYDLVINENNVQVCV